jgi:hypothetical protein
MANVRVTDKDTITSFSNPTTADYAGVFIAGGDKKMLWSKVKEYVLEAGTIGGTSAGDIADIDSAQTMTNKRFTSPKLNEDVAVTATATEVNVLDGIPPTLTATELGYVDGVTSAIQTQIDALAGRYAEIYIVGGTTAQSVGDSAWTALTQFATDGTNGEASTGMTAAVADNKITVGTAGVYLITYDICFISNKDTATHYFGIYRDGSLLPNSTVVIYAIDKTKHETVSVQFLYKEGAPSKDYQLRYYQASGGAVELTMESCNITITRVGQ